MQRLERLTALFRRRWACPFLAHLHRTNGTKFITLVNTLGASEGATRQTLDELIDLGWVARNSGYGHPLRPEYLLTRRGEKLAPACARLDSLLASIDERDLALRKWSMPVLYVIGDGTSRFSEIARSIGHVTDRALSHSLKDLSDAALIARRLIDASPPTSLYAPTPAGDRLLPILHEL